MTSVVGPSRLAIGGATVTGRASTRQPGKWIVTSREWNGLMSGLDGLRLRMSYQMKAPPGRTSRAISAAIPGLAPSGTELNTVIASTPSKDSLGNGRAAASATRN